MPTGYDELTVLYGPALTPPEPWLKKALLHADNVSTVVSDRYDVPDRLRQLEDLGAWKPARLMELSPDALDAMAAEAIEVADQFPWVPDSFPSGDRILIGKFPHIIEQHLVRQRLLSGVPEDPTRYGAVDDRLLPTMLNICASHFAQERGWRVDVPSRIHVLGTVTPLRSSRSDGVLITVDGLPEVQRQATLADVIAFRERHPAELAAYRRCLAKMEADLATVSDIEEATSSLRRETDTLVAAARQANLPLAKRPRTWVRGVAAPDQALFNLGVAAGAAGTAAGIDSWAGRFGLLSLGLNLSGQMVRVRRRNMAVAYLKKAIAESLV